MKKKVTAIFDIGRTNKKFFLFDGAFQEVYREYAHFDEIADEDGYPTENVRALEEWAKEVFYRMVEVPDYDVVSLNFSGYGASLVHIDENGRVLTPLYNYMKPLAAQVSDSFYAKYGPEAVISRVTGSPKLGMLNTGMQLYWLKETKPETFKKIKYALHLPQYLSYLFTGFPVSEYTSIGCHTLLWDYGKKAYHDWVYQEKIDQVLPPVVPTNTTFDIPINGKSIKIGVGIHDSSSALVPYVRSLSKPFVLVSTGTWSISINPFTQEPLSKEDIAHGSLYNMQVNGSPAKASRLFLGNEHQLQVKVLSAHFNVPETYHRGVKFDPTVFFELQRAFQPMFKWKSIADAHTIAKTRIPFDTFEHAYHQLVYELVLLQIKSIEAVIGNEPIDRLFVDGGFSDNEIYMQLLAHFLGHLKIETTDASIGSALGAAIVISPSQLKPDFLEKNYALKELSVLKTN